jgi:glycosyltransferase involved in cell wall biosynthesis
MNSKSIDFVLLIPCYNNISGLSASLKSISYPVAKFEVLIVDDGSTDPITKNGLQVADAGMVIHIIRLERNQGIVKALNAGLTALRSRTDFNYIARLDAGDTCNEQRFHKQVDFLNQHPEIALLASWARFQSADSNSGYDYITKITHQDIIKEMHYKCSFIHPSVMFRKEVLDTIGLYPMMYPHAEDYAFFWKILKQYKSAVIPEKLVQISYSDANVSAENYKKQLRSRKKIIHDFGDNWLNKMVGVGMLNLKLVLPKGMIQWLKSLILPV